MITAALALLARLAKDADTGVEPGRLLQGRPARPVQVVTELDLAGLARGELPAVDDPDAERWYGTTAAPRILLALSSAAAIDLPVASATLVGAPGAVYAATAAAVDDARGGSHVLVHELHATLRAFARAVVLPFTRVAGARKVLVEDGVSFAPPDVVQYAARPADPRDPVLSRTLLCTMAASDPFLYRAPGA